MRRCFTLVLSTLLLFACAPDPSVPSHFADPALPSVAPDIGVVHPVGPHHRELPRGLERILTIWIQRGDTSEEDVRAVLGEVAAWYRGVSIGKYEPAFDLAGPFTLPSPSGAGDPQPLHVASVAGFDLAAYDRFLVLETGGGDRDEALPPADLAVPGAPLALHAARILVGSITNSMESVGRVVQQIGFSLDLASADHVSALDGEVRAGGNLSDVMGASRFRGAFGAPAQQLLGWLDDDDIVTADGPGDHRVAALEGGRDVRALRVPIPTPQGEGGRFWLYAEVRRPIGPAAEGAAIYDVPDGAMINVVRDPEGSSGLATRSLDATPETPSLDSADAALLPGRTLQVPGTDLFLSVLASEEGGAHLRLLEGGPGNAPPVIRAVTATQEEGGWRLSVDADDPDGDELDAFWNLGVRRLPTGNPDSQVEPAFFEPGTYASGLSIQHMFSDGRPRRVSVRVTDRRGGEALGFVDLLGHENRPPEIKAITVTPLQDGRYLLEATATDLDGDLLRFAWSGPFGQTSRLPSFAVMGDPAAVELVVDDGELATSRRP